MNSKEIWNSKPIKLLRWLLFVPITFIVLNIVEIGLLLLLEEVLFKTKSLFFIFAGGFGILIILPMVLGSVSSFFASAICPNKRVGGYTYALFSLIFFLHLLYVIWSLDINYDFKNIFILGMSSIAILITLLYSIQGSIGETLTNKQN